MKRQLFILVALALALALASGLFLSTSAQANPAQEALALVLKAYVDRQRLAGPLPDLAISKAIEVQDLLMMNLAPDYGSVAGYQRDSGTDGALLSTVLLENMFTTSGATLHRARDSNPSVELELLVRVGSERINKADTLAAVAAQISEVLPAVEVRDQLLMATQGLNSAALIAINGGVRYLVLGRPLVVPSSITVDDWAGVFAAHLFQKDGKTVSHGSGLVTGTNPLQAVLELKQLLQKRGRFLKAGDLLALGSIGLAVEPDTNGRFEASFETPFGSGRVVFALR
jgi:2-keto-4-pentenoate hydratase